MTESLRFVEGEHEPMECSPSAEDEAIDRETADELREAFSFLTPKQQLVIQLRFGFWDGKRYKLREVASVMGITNQAASRLEERALDSLRSRLKNAWIPTVFLGQS